MFDIQRVNTLVLTLPPDIIDDLEFCTSMLAMTESDIEDIFVVVMDPFADDADRVSRVMDLTDLVETTHWYSDNIGTVFLRSAMRVVRALERKLRSINPRNDHYFPLHYETHYGTALLFERRGLESAASTSGHKTSRFYAGLEGIL